MTKLTKAVSPALILTMLLASHNVGSAQQNGMIVRLSEIAVNRPDLETYKTILKEEADASVRLESGVIAIFPMYQKDHPTEIRILEIYASCEAYESHLTTAHFQKYKTSTLTMVKSLKLIDMDAIDAAAMTQVFKKMKRTE